MDFDRRVPRALLEALATGPFSWVTELARTPAGGTTPPLDLGLRASPRKPGHGTATLYLGTTQVLGLHVRPAGRDAAAGLADARFSLSPHTRGGLFKDVDPALPFDAAWSEWRVLEHYAGLAAGIRRHVDAAIEAAPGERQREGRDQAALSKDPSAAYVLVDREVMLTFESTDAKRRCVEGLREDLVHTQRDLAAADYRWAQNVKPPGDKLDALAIDSAGRLLTIEVKPGTEWRQLSWTPVQVAMYARLLRAWVEQDHDHAREVLEGMAAQRVTLGVAGHPVPTVRTPIEVIPVIAVGRPVENLPVAAERFDLIREALGAHGEPLEGLQLWTIDGTGEVSATHASELDPRFASTPPPAASGLSPPGDLTP